MFGALTAADPDEFIEEDIEATPTGFEVGVSEGIVADLTPAYDAAIKRLREQRGGLSAKERLGALLVGFGQPTRHGKWQESLGNASQMLFQQSLARRKEDEDRRSQLEKLMSAREVAKIRANATTEAARIRAEKAAAASGEGSPIVAALGRKPNADEVKRIGYAQRLWPELPPQEIAKMLYHPKVEVFMLRPSVVSGAASQGFDVDAALGTLGQGVGAPTLNEFLIEARKANPGVGDADLTAYYNKKYGEE